MRYLQQGMLFSAIVLSAFLTGHSRGYELRSSIRGFTWWFPDTLAYTYTVITVCLFIYFALSFARVSIIAAFMRFALLSLAIYQYQSIFYYHSLSIADGCRYTSWLSEPIPLDIANFVLIVGIYLSDIFSTVRGRRRIGTSDRIK